MSAGLSMRTGPITMCSSTMSRKWSIYSNRFLNESTARHHSGLTTIRVQRSVFLRSSWFDTSKRDNSVSLGRVMVWHEPVEMPLQNFAFEADEILFGGWLAKPSCSSMRVTLTLPSCQVIIKLNSPLRSTLVFVSNCSGRCRERVAVAFNGYRIPPDIDRAFRESLRFPVGSG